MCFNWSPWVRGGELDGPEHPVRAFGPILAPWVSGRFGVGVSAQADGFTVRKTGCLTVSPHAQEASDLR
jgi:hypothetical protein